MANVSQMLVASVLIAFAIQLPTDTRRESGVTFPAQFDPQLGGTPHLLAGTATRERTVFRVNVYAYGLYVEPEAARKELAAFAGQSPEALDRNPAFLRRLLDMRVPMTLRLVTTRTLPGDALRNAFDEELTPRVARTDPSTSSEAKVALSQFRGFFNVDEMAEGSELLFSCTTAGALHTVVRAERRPVIQSIGLCRALFDVYLGERAVSAAGRRRLLAGLPAILKAR